MGLMTLPESNTSITKQSVLLNMLRRTNRIFRFQQLTSYVPPTSRKDRIARCEPRRTQQNQDESGESRPSILNWCDNFSSQLDCFTYHSATFSRNSIRIPTGSTRIVLYPTSSSYGSRFISIGLTARGKSRHGIRPSLHPGGLRCDSGTYSEYAPESRLVRRAQERSRCSRDFHHGLLTTVAICF